MDQFPSISKATFAAVCQKLEQSLKSCAVACNYFRQDAQDCLIIKQNVVDQNATQLFLQRDSEEDVVVQDDEDLTCFDVQRSEMGRIPVEYHVLLSPTYRVPILYFQARQALDSNKSNDVEGALQHLVPSSFKTQAQAVGVMGAISLTNHPINGFSFFFIHPCNTADALREIVGTRKISPSEYMLVWLGLIGSVVGLVLPKELATIIV